MKGKGAELEQSLADFTFCCSLLAHKLAARFMFTIIQ